MADGEAKIHGIEFEIKGSAADAAGSLENLRKTLTKLSKINFELVSHQLSLLSADIEVLNNSIKSLDISKLDAFAKSLGKIAKAGGSISLGFAGLPQVTRDVSDLAATTENLMTKTLVPSKYTLLDPEKQWAAEMTAQVESKDRGYLANMRETFDMSGMDEAKEKLKALGSAISNVFHRASTDSKKAESMNKALRSVKNNAHKATGGLAAFAKKALLFLPRKAINSAKEFATKLGDVVRSFKRIVGYRIIRSIIREITQGFQEGIQHIYQWSKAMAEAGSGDMGRFASNMDDAATSLAYFKNAVGAAAAPLMNILAPALRAVTDAAVSLLNVISQLFALLTGQSSWTRAVRYATEYGEAIGGAGGAAKEALKYLAPFDELNVLPDDKNRGGGGGAAEDFASMFEEVEEFESKLANFATNIKKAIQKADWKGLGTLLGKKINSIIGKVDFAGIGKKVGENINAWFTTKYWTLKETNFQEIGKKIAQFFTGDENGGGILGQIDFETVGRSIARKFTIIPDLIIGVLDGLDWDEIGEDLNDLISGAFNEITDWLVGVDWVSVGSDVWTAIKNVLIDPVVAGDVASSVFETLGVAIGSAAEALWGIATTIVEDLTAAVSKNIVDYNGDNKVDVIEVLGAIIYTASDVLEWAWGKIGQPLVNGIIKGFTGDERYTISIRLTDAFALFLAWLDDLPTKVKNVAIKIANAFSSKVQEGINKIITAYNNWVDDVQKSDWAPQWLKDLVGKLPEVHFDLTPEIPEEELNKNFNEAKQYLEEKSAHETVKTQITAVIRDLENKLTKNQVTFSSIADFVSRFNHLSQGKRTFSSIADFVSRYVHLGEKNVTFKSIANFVTSLANFGKGGLVFDAVAEFVSRILGFTDGGTTFDAVANFIKKLSGFKNGDLTFSTVADFTSRVVSIATSFISEAFFKKYKVDDPLKDGQNMKVDTTAVIKRTEGTIRGVQYVTAAANGGMFTHGGWRPITSYASGGYPYGGQIFRARENGNPELVGTLNGSTAVMNNNQIVASVSAGVAKAIAGISFQLRGFTPTVVSQPDEGMTEDMLYRAFVRALNDTEETIELDGSVVYQKMLKRNREETTRLGLNPMAALA